MGIGDALSALFSSSPKLKALMIFPSKEIRIMDVKINDNTFMFEKDTYIVDEKAIYFFKKQPFLFYVKGTTSPLLIRHDGADSSLRATEIRAVLESKAVQQILTAAQGDDRGMLFYAAIASAAASILAALILSGVLKIGPLY